MQTEQGSYDYVDTGANRVRLSVGFLNAGGGLTVEVKESSPQQPFPSTLQPDLSLEDTEHPRMVA
jgi:hypothetical protein